MKRRILLPAAVLSTVIPLAFTVLGESPRAIYEAAKKSTFLIETFDSKGIPLSIGTGFAATSNYLASNCHVIKGASRVHAKGIGLNEVVPIEGIAAVDLEADLVLLRIGSCEDTFGH